MELTSFGIRGLAQYQHQNPGNNSLCHISRNTYFQTSLIFSGGIVDSDGNPYYTCWTNANTKDLMAGAPISASTPLVFPARRDPAQLVDGIYDKNLESCSLVKMDSYGKTYILFDFGRVHPISHVSVIGQTSFYIHENFRNFEVRLGNDFQSGDFSSYTLIGFFGLTTESDKVYLMSLGVPIQARYIETIEGKPPEKRLLVCHAVVA